MTWIYKNKELTELPENTAGFIYCITNLTNNKKYIGRKYTTSRTTKKIKTISKTAKSATKRKVTISESNWKKYWGSNKPLLEDIKVLGEDKFKKEILIFAETRAIVNFLECVYQFKTLALLDETYYNTCIGSRDFISLANNKKVKEIVESIK